MSPRRLGLAAARVLVAWFCVSGAAAAEPGPPPQRIVSLLPSLTETVCALGACERLVGVDRHSNWPESVRRLPQLGGLEDTPIERIVSLKPELVLLAGSSRAEARLRSLGVPVLVLEPQDWAGTLKAVEVLAARLALPHAGAALVARLQARVDAAAAEVPERWRGRAAYVEVASTPFAAGPGSFIGELLGRLGLGNVVPAGLGAFPQLSPEFVIRAQPALVVATERGLAEMPRRPGWAQLRALQRRHACGLAPQAWDTLVRPGPRLADAAEALAACLRALPPPD